MRHGRNVLVALSLLVASSASAQLDGATSTRVETILEDYEAIRGALANDRGGVAAPARRIRSNAAEAARHASGPPRAMLRAIASKARALASVDASNMAALRVAFGRLSEPLIALVRGDTRLQRGRHLFECPMAQGYGGWIQSSEQISNPYMGQRMLTCGAGREW